MRILILNRFGYNGGGSRVFSLAGELNRQGLKTAVIMTGCPDRSGELCRRYSGGKIPFFTESGPEAISAIARQHRAKLVHVYSSSLLPLAHKLSGNLLIPFGFTVHDPPAPQFNALLQRASFVITTNPSLKAALSNLNRRVVFIPEGVDLQAFQPAPREDFRITFIGEAGGYTAEGYQALLKAAVLADMPVDIICHEQSPVFNGRFYGWLPHCASVLRRSQVVAGRGRGLLEGMACGNAALILGKSYHGILQPQSFAPAQFPDLSGAGTVEPCYRSIFYDLSQLWKDRHYLSALQRWGRQFVRENCDLRLTAEATARVYEAAL